MGDCCVCSKSFQALCTLRRHLKEIHLFDAEKTIELVPRKKKNYDISSFKHVCLQCSKCFNISKNYQYHMRHAHQLSEPETESYRKAEACLVKCALCSNKARERDMAEHFKVEHGITLEVDDVWFDSCNTFFQWKKNIERRTSCKFILKHQKSKSRHVYVCHRSGEFKSRGKGLRLLKGQGSKKIGAYCPAAIRLKIFNDKCYAQFTETHVGHDNELCHISLSPAEREEIAKKLYLNVPKTMVLDEIKESAEGQLERIHLLTAKDLHNISRDYGISCEKKNVNDDVRVNELITEMQSEENSPIIYYKPQNCTDEANPFLKSTDFVLIIMNDAQKEMLSAYGKNIVCFDGTHDMGYDFILYTILVLDSVYQGFPCCFLLTNRADEAIFTFLFTKIKNTIAKLNENITEINAFMSDMENSFINAWSNVMGKPKRQLFCTWHVDRAWKQNLAKKVIGSQKQNQVYSMLRILLEEMDENQFEILLQDTIARLKTNPDTNDFASYFEENYFCNAEAWAYCHRKISGLNSNTHLESMHRTLKYVYLEGKKVKRLDKIICLLMKLIKDKLFDQMTVAHKVQLTKSIANIRRRHQTAINESNLITYDDSTCKWMVSSKVSYKELYYVERNMFDCKCCLICTLCESCIHNYICTCVDYTLRGNMCKHIHQVCMIIAKQKDEDLENYSPEYENLIPLMVEETLPNSQQGKEFESVVVQETSKENKEDIPIENLQNKWNKLLASAKTSKDRRIVLLYLNKADLCLQSENMVSEKL